ncbi:Capsular polysaccharide synthesis enzyme CpsE [Winogradskyella psychrotolerans RS-3]|uniref:Capsular polysaccharide synthesis enzyme CpsE n=1 Tax=Winogradskyella psychrotolerans RS-3 TaxID=641526 RepID=S7VX84_9FLAO|nr:capsular polysaccharide synthesis enzyme CpsE [Winogradskyella psychrotolerans]EPR74701.1 Capsular polysaccharide synthesis enzyme CpsE [Winogradskyella psychrotolerans RS-3]
MKLKNRIKRRLLGFFKSFYSFDKYMYQRDLSKSRMFSEDLILIYTMGKVASTSLYESLKNVYPNKDIFHLHRLNGSYLDEREKMIKSEVFGNKEYPRHLSTGLLWKPQWLSAIIKENKFNNLKLITVIREPISRNISLFFQWIDFKETEDKYIFKSRNNNYPFEITTPKNDLTELYDFFYTKFVIDSHLEWFKSEMYSVFDIDVFDNSFNKEKGYSIIEKENVTLLVFKMEQITKSFNPAMVDLFGEEIELIRANEASSKPINKVYVDFKNNIRLPREYVDKLYNSEYMKHFYTELEINSFKNKWLKN